MISSSYQCGNIECAMYNQTNSQTGDKSQDSKWYDKDNHDSIDN